MGSSIQISIETIRSVQESITLYCYSDKCTEKTKFRNNNNVWTIEFLYDNFAKHLKSKAHYGIDCVAWRRQPFRNWICIIAWEKCTLRASFNPSSSLLMFSSALSLALSCRSIRFSRVSRSVRNANERLANFSWKIQKRCFHWIIKIMKGYLWNKHQSLVCDMIPESLNLNSEC